MDSEEAGDDGRMGRWVGNDGDDEEEACHYDEEKEEAGKDGVDDEADINDNEEKAQAGEKAPTRAEGIVTWHGTGGDKGRASSCRVAPFLNYITKQ